MKTMSKIFWHKYFFAYGYFPPYAFSLSKALIKPGWVNGQPRHWTPGKELDGSLPLPPAKGIGGLLFFCEKMPETR